jgi:hypothetical protein
MHKVGQMDLANLTVGYILWHSVYKRTDGATVLSTEGLCWFLMVTSNSGI